MFKLLYPFANVMGLFFPIGKLENGGTCEFATPKCLKKCCAHAPGAGMKVGLQRKKTIYSFFLENSVDKIVAQILNELHEVNCRIFTWFASGDCPSFLTLKFFNIINRLDEKGIIQTGFTRNKNLWEHCTKGIKNGKVLLTVENIEDSPKKSGMYSIPNYEIGVIDIYRITFSEKYVRSGCGGGYYENHIKDSEKDISHLKLDCRACFENKTGCFEDGAVGLTSG